MSSYFRDVHRIGDIFKSLKQPCDWHPRIDSVVYHGMDWNCPSYTQRLAEEIQKHWGNITPELLISDIIAKV